MLKSFNFLSKENEEQVFDEIENYQPNIIGLSTTFILTPKHFIEVTTNLKKRFPRIRKNLVFEDFTKELPFEKNFDFVIDRSSITHNSTKEIKNCLDLVRQKLRKNGKLICIDWFSTHHFEYKNGEKTDDPFTKKNYKTGQFKKVGNVHFSNKKHLLNLFENFKIEILDEKIIKRKIPNNKESFAAWNIVTQKR